MLKLKFAQKNTKSSGLSDVELNVETSKRIKGLTYIPEFVTEQREIAILKQINENQWQSDLGRSVQHYGWLFEEKDRDIETPRFKEDLPEWADQLANQFKESKLTEQYCDYILVNKYSAGEGISPHIDFDSCFSNYIFILSLSSALVMELQNIETNAVERILLEPRSLLCLTNDARYRWTHSIKETSSEKFNGKRIDRKERVSLTFRKVIK